MTQRVLARDITLFQAIALGINTTIGAGILIMPGLVASQTGIAVLLNALLCFVVSVTVALSLSELATGLPRAGGSYYYINRSLGPFWGCVAGITQGISLMFAMAFCAVCFGFYLQYLWPQLAALPITIARILFLIITHVIGSRSHPVRRILLTIGLVALLIIPALQGFLSLQASPGAGAIEIFRDASPWTHWRQGIAGAGIFFIAFLGFETIADVGEEVQTPQRTIPLSMLTTIAVVSILYLPLLIVCLGILPLDEFLRSRAPLSLLADQLWHQWGVLAVTVGVFFATATSTSALALSANRLTFAMSRDGLLSPWLSQISPRFRTPIRSIGLMGAIVLTLIFVQDVTLLAAIASFAYLLTYSLVHLALIVLRFVQPDWYRPRFRCPAYPVTPLLGLGLMLLMILNLPIRIFVLGGGIVAIAGIWYWKVARFRVVASGELDSFADSLNRSTPCYTVLLPVANPRTEATLVRLATAIAFSHQDQPDSQAQLVGMTAIETPPQAALEQQLLSQQRRIESQQVLLEQVRKHVEQARQAYRAKDSNPANLQVQLINVASRSLAGAVLDLTRKTDANLIILGWPSTSSMPERLYDTAVGTLVRKAPCDVCVLKLTYDQFQRVLVPVGFGPNTRLTVGIALAIAQGLSVPIEFISVMQPSHPLFGNATTLQDRWQEMALTLGIKPQPLHLLEPGPVVERLAAYAQPEDLVCIGSNRSVRFQRLLFGTIPEAIARETTSSVLLVRQQDPVQRWLKIWPFWQQPSADKN